LKLISTVKSTQQTIQLLLSTSDYLGALDLIYTTQKLLDNELAGVHSFRHMNLQLGEMINLIEKIMQADFLKLTMQMSEADMAGNENMAAEKEECRDQLIPIVIGLLRLSKFQITLQAYKEQVISMIKKIIKKVGIFLEFSLMSRP
jgi:vacuolar protein sorting-associated protein 54